MGVFSHPRAAHGMAPGSVGIGLRAEHYDALSRELPALAFLEVHSENYLGAGGRPLQVLARVRCDYAVSLHGVGMSLGSTDALDRQHLEQLKALIVRTDPVLVSEHLCWSSVNGMHFHDLLPLPYTEEALHHMVARIAAVQELLGRQILVENISSYLEFDHSTIPEWEFLAALAASSGCGLLLDVNNIYVASVNQGFSAERYLHAIPPELVKEIHLAGHAEKEIDDGRLLIDTHDSRVVDAVWNLYAEAVEHLGLKPTLVEWDSDLPALPVLVEEAHKAARVMEIYHALAA